MFPIRDNVPSRRLPVAMWALIGVNIFMFVFQLGLPQERLLRLVHFFGIVPKRYVHPDWAVWAGFPADDYWPFLTSMFLHGGWFHIIANMWTLWIFGDNVEDRMGPLRFLLFYLLCGIASGIIHMISTPLSTVPAIGASGAIAGVLAAYLFLYPRAQVICVVPILFFPVFFELSALVFILIWFFSQFISGSLSLMSPQEGGGIAWWAHIGGFAFGALTHRFFVSKPRPPDPYSDVSRLQRRWDTRRHY
jgi:membrane associated rhomboid family serine protease